MRNPGSHLSLLVCLSGLTSAIAAGPAAAAPSQPPAVEQPGEHGQAPPPGQPAPLELDDAPETLLPRKPRTEAESDRLEAVALFAAARTRERRSDYEEALRLYQRALRCDPEALAVARAIVPLAYRLKRYDEAVRYALKVVELEEPDPFLLRALARHLVESGDIERAITLYEKAVNARAGEKPSAVEVAMWMELGHFHHVVGQHEKAARRFARVVEALKNPDEFGLDGRAVKILLADGGTTFQAMGESFLQCGRLDEALAAFEKSHELTPDEGLLGLGRARVLLKKKRPDEALKALQVYFDSKQTTQATLPYEVLAEILRAQGKADALIARLEKLRSDDGENVPLGYFLAECYDGAGELDKAAELYGEVLKKTATLDGYRALAEIHRRTGDGSKLLDVLADLVGKTSSLEALGEEACGRLAEPATVRRVLEAARARRARGEAELSFEASLAAALLALRSERPEPASELFEIALAARPKRAGDLLLRWGVGLLVAGEPEKAAEVFRRGIEEEPPPDETPVFHFYLAGALELAGKTDEALAAARKAAELRPDTARFQSRVAWVLYHAERYAEAEAAYKALVEKYDSDYDSAENRQILRDARLVLSSICVIAGRNAEGEEWLEQVLDEFPDDVGALNDLGYLWADAGKHLQRALRMIRRAVEQEPENPAYRDSLGWVLYRLGRYREAVTELQTAARGEETDPVIFDHLGDACAATGAKEKARRAWKRAAEAFRREGGTREAEAVEQKLRRNPGTTKRDLKVQDK